MLNEHLKLLIKRERKEVLGKRAVNLWILTAVLIATFVSMAFSNASLEYLSHKMDDPFTNWVNIIKGYQDDNSFFERFYKTLDEDTILHRYGIKNAMADVKYGLDIFDINDESHYFQFRFFEEMDGDLMRAILDHDNVIKEGLSVEPDDLVSETYGVIVTSDAITKKLGYSLDSIPPYIFLEAYSPGGDSIGADLLLSDNRFAKIPLPLLAVVKRLPMNYEFAASKFLYVQNKAQGNLLSLSHNHEKYLREQRFFVSDAVENFQDEVLTFIPDSLKTYYSIQETEEIVQSRMRNWKKGKVYTLGWGAKTNIISTSDYQQISRAIQGHFSLLDVCRIYDYDVKPNETTSEVSFLSLNFTSLDSIRSFEHFAKDNFNIQVEMSQVKDKENFHSISILANILSWAIIILAIVCIVIYIVNMLQSYFSKVKRNLGTFKAFGMRSSDLIRVYVLILLGIICSALIFSLSFTWLIELILPVFNILKEGKYDYLALWNEKTFASIIIIIVATITTVILVMKELLKKTPGDLIYDR